MLRTLILCAMLCAAPANAGLFGSAEFARSEGGPLDRWRAMTAREAADRCGPVEIAFRPFEDLAPGDGRPSRPVTCGGRPALNARALVAKLSHETPAAQLATVNAAVNRVAYVEDRANYGADDYWASIDEFLARGGDCEDFATAKYMLLRRAGVPAEAMRVVVVRDIELGSSHAVLAVTIGGEAYVLDNQAADVKPASAVARYRPVYSINETGWWLHMPQS